MLQSARMAGLVKLRFSGGHLAERPVWAGHDRLVAHRSALKRRSDLNPDIKSVVVADW